MSRCSVFSLFLLFGCGQSRDPFPAGTIGDETEETDEENNSGPNPDDCMDSWTIQAEGVAIQPEACIAWSPPSEDGMNWYEAASVDDGELGGCGDDCPDGAGYCATLALNGKNDWRLPSLEELKDAAMSQPDIPDMDGKLWSRKSGQGSTSNAWVVDLGQPGLWLELPKDDDGIYVRCVSDS